MQNLGSTAAPQQQQLHQQQNNHHHQWPSITAIFSGISANLRDPNPKPTFLLYIFLAISLLSITLILSLSSSSSSPATHHGPDPFLYPTRRFVYDYDKSAPSPPSIAYLISGSRGDSYRILRVLHATYHPLNHYLLHLDPSAPHADRERVALALQSNRIFGAAQNVHVMGKPDFAYRKGSSPVSQALHAASILVRLGLKWDWFVSLSADSYPLVSQDDLLHIMSFLPKDMNFVNHSSYIGWKELRKLKPIIVDPGLYLSEGSEMFYATQKRELPSAFRMFTGMLAFGIPLEERTKIMKNLVERLWLSGMTGHISKDHFKGNVFGKIAASDIDLKAVENCLSWVRHLWRKPTVT